MHPEAEEELRVRLKLVVLDLADHLGVTKACREFEVLVPAFIVGNRNTRKQDRFDCIEKGQSLITIPAGHLLRWWRKFWNSERSTNWEPYGFGITWSATTESRSPNPQ